MAEPPRQSGTGDDTGAEPDRGTTTGLAPWQKVVGIVGLIVVALVAFMLLAGGGHGPGRHGIASPVADNAVQTAVTANDFADDSGEITVAADGRETATGGFRADRPGRYTFYCAEPGHRQAGMEGTLVVEAGGHTPGGFEDRRG